MHNKDNLIAEATEIKMFAWYIFQLKNQIFLTITQIHLDRYLRPLSRQKKITHKDKHLYIDYYIINHI